MTLVHKLLLATAFLLFSCFTIKNTNPCSLKKSKIDVNNLRELLLHNDGYWEYVYSYGKINGYSKGKDTCLVFEEGALKIPSTFLFKEVDTIGLKEKHPWYYKKHKNKKLYGLISYNKGYEQASYPIVTNVSRDSTVAYMYNYGTPIKSYVDDYYLKKIKNDTMTLSIHYQHYEGSRKINLVRHVYVNKPAS